MTHDTTPPTPAAPATNEGGYRIEQQRLNAMGRGAKRGHVIATSAQISAGGLELRRTNQGARLVQVRSRAMTHAPATKKCSACKAEIHFYRAVIGGKRYGDCKCERARTWIMDASGVRFVNHNGTQHDAGCSCNYSELHGARS